MRACAFRFQPPPCLVSPQAVDDFCALTAVSRDASVAVSTEAGKARSIGGGAVKVCVCARMRPRVNARETAVITHIIVRR